MPPTSLRCGSTRRRRRALGSPWSHPSSPRLCVKPPRAPGRLLYQSSPEERVEAVDAAHLEVDACASRQSVASAALNGCRAFVDVARPLPWRVGLVPENHSSACLLPNSCGNAPFHSGWCVVGMGEWGRGFRISGVGLPEKRLTIDSISRDSGVRPGLRRHASEEGAEGLCRTCS